MPGKTESKLKASHIFCNDLILQRFYYFQGDERIIKSGNFVELPTDEEDDTLKGTK